MTVEQVSKPEIRWKHKQAIKLYHENEVEGSLIGDSLIVEQIPVESQESVQFHQRKSLISHHFAPVWKKFYHGAEEPINIKVVIDTNEEDHEVCEQVVNQTVDGDNVNWFRVEEVFPDQFTNPDTQVDDEKWYDEHEEHRSVSILSEIWRCHWSIVRMIVFHHVCQIKH